MIYKKSALNLSKYKIHPKNIAIFAVSLVLMLFFAAPGGSADTPEYLTVLYEMPVQYVWIFFASSISSVGMLIPGVGGALIMLVLGIYTVYIEALANLDFIVLLTLVAGMVFGMISGIRAVRKILGAYPGELYSAILGFTIGSVFVVFPGFSASVMGLVSAVFAILLTAAAYQISKRS